MTSQSSTDDRPFTIAIVGGGLGGLALAVGFLKHNISFRIYEAAPTFAEIGAGIAFGPNSIRALGLIDQRLLEGYRKHAAFNESPDKSKTFMTTILGTDLRASNKDEAVRGKAGDVIWRLDDMDELDAWTGLKTRSCIHRARLLEEFAALIPPDVASFNKALDDIEELEDGSGVRLHFSDGTSAFASAVIGCDGIKSKTRVSICGKLEPQFAEGYAYRAMISRSEFENIFDNEAAGNGTIYWGYGGYSIHYPVEKGNYINMFALVCKPGLKWDDKEWQVPASKEEMMKDLSGWDPRISHGLLLNPKIEKWALFHLPHSDPYYKGRICIMGDAAHATTPHLGAGAGMAMEDAFILSNLVGQASTASDLERAFMAYDSVRRPRTQVVIESSLLAGMEYAFRGEGVGDDIEQLTTIIRKRFYELWHLHLVADLESAKEIMATS